MDSHNNDEKITTFVERENIYKENWIIHIPTKSPASLLRSRQAVQRGPRWTKERDAVTTKN